MAQDRDLGGERLRFEQAFGRGEPQLLADQ
jgi:hypothetical protein